MKGMNPFSVEAMAHELRAEAGRLIAGAEEALGVMKSLQWVGDDRDAFEQELIALCDLTKQGANELTALAEKATYEAQEQRLTSAA